MDFEIYFSDLMVLSPVEIGVDIRIRADINGIVFLSAQAFDTVEEAIKTIESIVEHG